MSKLLYVRDHEGFACLTVETHRNRWFAAHIVLTKDCGCLKLLNERDLEFYKFLFTFLAMAEKLVNFNIDELVTSFESHDIDHYYTELEREYYRLVTAGKFCGRVSIKSLMFSIVNCAVKAGSPFILLKEACNAHFWRDLQGEAMNAANLCAEVLQPSRKSVATCNLANICLPRCLVNAPLAVRAQRADTQGDELLLALPRLSVTLPGEGAVGDGFSLARLRDATQCATFVVACSILQGSPTYDSRDMASMGLGVQGLADVFADLGWQYTDPPSRSLNKEIFEHMYFTALCTSSLIGLHTRKIFPGFKQSKYAGGWFHWHDWAGTDLSIPREIWSRLSERIVRDGLFNSQFIALMPTSGCAQVTGCSDAFYPFYANASTKVTNKEEALRPNRSFWRHVRLDDREALNLVGGRVSCLPEALRQRYLRFQTAFDYNQEDLIQMSRDRAPFVDQSQSHSLFLREEDAARASTLAHERCPGIFTGLFVPELFFKLFRDTPWSDWYLFDPKDAGDLERLYGEEFEREYYRLVTAGKFCGRVSIKLHPPRLAERGSAPGAYRGPRVSAFAQSPAYERIVSSGYLSALRYYDTYLYVGRSGKQESVQHFYMRLAGFCASTTCLYAGLRAALQRARPEIESDMEVFDYYFATTAPQPWLTWSRTLGGWWPTAASTTSSPPWAPWWRI